jgi:Flp pilus assembly protein TadG
VFVRPATRLKTALARFARAQRGATAVEFGLVGMLAMLMLFGVLELGLILLTVVTLENATEHVSRRIRTGDFQTNTANTKAAFKTEVCAAMTWLESTCDEKLDVDVRTFDDFAGLAASTPQPAEEFDPDSTCWTPGQPTDIVLVRVYYRWRLITPLMGQVFESMGPGSGVRLLSIATAFRNEPYSDDPPEGAAC